MLSDLGQHVGAFVIVKMAAVQKARWPGLVPGLASVSGRSGSVKFPTLGRREATRYAAGRCLCYRCQLCAHAAARASLTATAVGWTIFCMTLLQAGSKVLPKTAHFFSIAAGQPPRDRRCRF